MVVTHKFNITGKCPNNNGIDYYEVCVIANTLIMCEEIISRTQKLLVEPVYQENFTQKLSDDLNCKVITICRHTTSPQVITTCECIPSK